MNAPGAPIDAIFLSPHKFVGGPGTPGVLAIKAELASNPVPATIGGGTVSWVSPRSHHYLKDVERREEAGTPAIVEAIRAGLVFQIKQTVGADEIHRRESALLSRAREALVGCDQIEILGPADAQRLSILSLRIRCGSRELHYGFVVALLNDLFGIQARGGCSCAGPYGHELLAIDDETSQRYEASIAGGCAAMRPGWVRLNLNYFVSEAECDYIVAALKLVAEHGWRILPAYQLDPENGSWRYAGRERILPVELASLLSGEVEVSMSVPEPDFEALLEEGRELLLQKVTVTTPVKRVLMSEANEALRWFALPEDLGEL